MKELGAVFVGYGLGIMQFAENPNTRIYFAIPMLLGMVLIGIDLIREERQTKVKKLTKKKEEKKIRKVKEIIQDLRNDKEAMKDLDKWLKEMEK
jgi:hypothetical protein